MSKIANTDYIVDGDWIHCRLNVYDKSLKDETGKETNEWDAFSVRIDEITCYKKRMLGYADKTDERMDEILVGGLASVIWRRNTGDAYVINIPVKELRKIIKEYDDSKRSCSTQK